MRSLIVVLGGALKCENGKWSTTRFGDVGDDFALVGDRLRVEAAYLLFVKYSCDKIIAVGGRGQFGDSGKVPTVSSVIKKELVAMGIDKSHISCEHDSGSTLQQLKAVKDVINNARHKPVITIISNRYHIPRLKAMIKYNNQLNSTFKELDYKLASAEDILIRENPKKWKVQIDEVYASELLKKRILLEKKGVEDLKLGTYKLR
jgi:hypothetical protein